MTIYVVFETDYFNGEEFRNSDKAFKNKEDAETYTKSMNKTNDCFYDIEEIEVE